VPLNPFALRASKGSQIMTGIAGLDRRQLHWRTASHALRTLILCIEHTSHPQFGAISSPASHPADADFIGSLITTFFCTELHLGQSNRRCSNPIGPALMLVSIIRDVHCGQRGRSIGVSRDVGENWGFA
jgi:hypothetical protein